MYLYFQTKGKENPMNVPCLHIPKGREKPTSVKGGNRLAPEGGDDRKDVNKREKLLLVRKEKEK